MRDQLLFCPFDGQTLVAIDQGDRFIGLVLENKYRIDEKVGEGGMGKVYRGTHILMDHTVALKILHPHLSSDQIAVERFRREARAAASIRHPNAVAVTDFGVNKETGLSYLVMEFLEGVELRHEIKRKGPLDFEESFIITQQICLALQAAHAKGIVHRDLKPDNIWLLKSEDRFPRVKVLDFGIAKLMANNVSDLTQQGVIVGTPYYMSPEQCVGDELDARSDIYSLGVIIYESLTGRVPFRAGTPMGVALKHANEPPVPPSELRAGLPIPIENVVLRALRKHRDERQSSAMELSQEFESALYQAGIDFKLLGTNTPQFSHALNTHADHTYQTEKSLSPDRRTPVDRTTRLGQSTAGESNSAARLMDTPQPEAGSGSDLFRQVMPGRFSVQSLIPESSASRKVLFAVMAVMLVVAVVIAFKLLTPQETISIENRNAGGVVVDEAAKTPPPPPPGMVYIPGGKFVMGYNGSDQPGEKPEHEVKVRAFLIDKYEVTVGDYYQFIKATNHRVPNNWPALWKQGKFNAEEAKRPVTGVTWFDARDYAASVSKRLPSEEEWEYAARGADKRLYPWGNDFNPNRANVGDPGERVIKPVGSYPADKSPFDVFDMAGNAFEWVGSDWSSYPKSNAPPMAGKIVRGGSYSRGRVYAMTTTRSILRPDAEQDDVGFRCAQDLPKQ
jgi:serine/threonine-protein kinase